MSPSLTMLTHDGPVRLQHLVTTVKVLMSLEIEIPFVSLSLPCSLTTGPLSPRILDFGSRSATLIFPPPLWRRSRLAIRYLCDRSPAQLCLIQFSFLCRYSWVLLEPTWVLLVCCILPDRLQFAYTRDKLLSIST
jgi:hypothetical protein